MKSSSYYRKRAWELAVNGAWAESDRCRRLAARARRTERTRKPKRRPLARKAPTR